jgi:hypothetical protein
MRMRTRRVMSKETEKPHPVSHSWFDHKEIIVLRTDGERNFYGVRDEHGEVISRVELRSSTEVNRQEARRQESVNALVDAIDAKGEQNGI